MRILSILALVLCISGWTITAKAWAGESHSPVPTPPPRIPLAEGSSESEIALDLLSQAEALTKNGSDPNELEALAKQAAELSTSLIGIDPGLAESLMQADADLREKAGRLKDKATKSDEPGADKSKTEGDKASPPKLDKDTVNQMLAKVDSLTNSVANTVRDTVAGIRTNLQNQAGGILSSLTALQTKLGAPSEPPKVDVPPTKNPWRADTTPSTKNPWRTDAVPQPKNPWRADANPELAVPEAVRREVRTGVVNGFNRVVGAINQYFPISKLLRQ